MSTLQPITWQMSIAYFLFYGPCLPTSGFMGPKPKACIPVRGLWLGTAFILPTYGMLACVLQQVFVLLSFLFLLNIKKGCFQMVELSKKSYSFFILFLFFYFVVKTILFYITIPVPSPSCPPVSLIFSPPPRYFSERVSFQIGNQQSLSHHLRQH